MIHPATTAISETFTARGIKHKVSEYKNMSIVEVSYSGDHVTGLVIRFLSTDDKNDVAVRILSFAKAPDNKRGVVLEIINELHQKYRYAKFVIGDDNNIRIEGDMPQCVNNVGEIAVEMCIRFIDIADKAYPLLMKAIWS